MNALLKKSLVAGAVASGLLVSGSMVHAAQPSANAFTDMTVSVPDVLILHYYNQIDVTLTSAEIAKSLGATVTAPDEGGTREEGGPKAVTTTYNLGDFSGDVGMTATGNALGSTTLTLLNAWAVNAIAGGGKNVQVTIALPAGKETLTTAGGSEISLSTPNVDVGAAPAFGGNNVTFGSPGMNPNNAQLGHVRFTMDLSNVTETGVHSGGQFQLTAEII